MSDENIKIVMDTFALKVVTENLMAVTLIQYADGYQDLARQSGAIAGYFLREYAMACQDDVDAILKDDSMTCNLYQQFMHLYVTDGWGNNIEESPEDSGEEFDETRPIHSGSSAIN